MLDKRNKKILVVDDEQEVLNIISDFLKPASYEVISATKGREAVNLAKQLKPDLIILDILMPDMDGGEVAAVLSDDPATVNIPIIFLTGILTKEEELLGTVKTGKYYVIAKPVAQKRLLEMIEKLLPGQ